MTLYVVTAQYKKRLEVFGPYETTTDARIVMHRLKGDETGEEFHIRLLIQLTPTGALPDPEPES